MLSHDMLKGRTVVWLFLMLVGCGAHKPISDAGVGVHRVKVTIDGTFGALTVPDTDTVVRSAEAARLDLVLSMEPSRRFRDGSLGQTVTFDSATLSLGADGEAFESLELEGRAVELRTFPDGEILTIGWVDRIAGADRFIDVFEVLFPAISPAPPSLASGDRASRRIIWPFLGERKLRWDSAVDATWHNEGSEVRGSTKNWKISYAGPWRIHGGRRAAPGRIVFKAEGEAEGTTWFDHKTGVMSAHDFVWSRLVTVEGSSGALSQKQVFAGTVRVLQ